MYSLSNPFMYGLLMCTCKYLVLWTRDIIYLKLVNFKLVQFNVLVFLYFYFVLLSM